MISFHTKINGQDFEIEVADGLTLELSDNKLTVKGTAKVLDAKAAEMHYHYHYSSTPAQPYWNQPGIVNPNPFVGPTVTYGTTTSGTVGITPEENNITCSLIQARAMQH